MSAIDSWRKVKRVVAATSAFGETPRVDENATFRTGGIQGRPQGSQSEPDPMPARTAAPYAQGSQNSQYQYTGQPSQNQDQGQPWPYTSPQPTGGPFNQVQRTHSSPAAANGFAQQSSPVQSFDPYYRGQAPSAPPQSFDTASSVPFNTPQRTYPPASNHFPQSQNIFPTDPHTLVKEYSLQPSKTITNKDHIPRRIIMITSIKLNMSSGWDLGAKALNRAHTSQISLVSAHTVGPTSLSRWLQNHSYCNIEIHELTVTQADMDTVPHVDPEKG
jgi:hypothetical protein